MVQMNISTPPPPFFLSSFTWRSAVVTPNPVCTPHSALKGLLLDCHPFSGFVRIKSQSETLSAPAPAVPPHHLLLPLLLHSLQLPAPSLSHLTRMDAIKEYFESVLESLLDQLAEDPAGLLMTFIIYMSPLLIISLFASFFLVREFEKEEKKKGDRSPILFNFSLLCSALFSLLCSGFPPSMVSIFLIFLFHSSSSSSSLFFNTLLFPFCFLFFHFFFSFFLFILVVKSKSPAAAIIASRAAAASSSSSSPPSSPSAPYRKGKKN